MIMKTDHQGLFDVIESFAIASRNEFYLIGQLKEGVIEANWFINIAFNSTLAMCVRIKSVEDIEMASDRGKYILIVVAADSELLDLLLGLKVGGELVTITIEGED